MMVGLSQMFLPGRICLVLSCSRSSRYRDASGSSQWYLEYSGTSMATPNTAGAAAMIREYLEEIALRESPQAR